MSSCPTSNPQQPSKIVSMSNPFQSYNHQQSQAQFEEHVQVLQNQTQYPLCLDTQCPESQNTPLSRLSQVTYKSEFVGCVYGGKNLGNNFSLSNQKSELLNRKNQQAITDLRAQVKSLTQALADTKNYSILLERRNEELAISLQKQKLKSTHLENALGILRKGQHQLDRKVMQQSELVSELREELDRERDCSACLAQKLENSLAENNYLKELILIANSNYEVLESKYTGLVEKNKKIEEQNLNKQKELTHSMQEMKNLLSNLITAPSASNALNHNLSFGEQDENCVRKSPASSNRVTQKKQVEEIYRKMFIKTLKSKR